MVEVMKVKEVAQRLGMSEQAVRVHLQLKHFDWGEAIPNRTGNGFTYVIPRAKFERYMGEANE